MNFFSVLFFFVWINVCVAQNNTADILVLVQEKDKELVQDLGELFSLEEQQALSQKLENYKRHTSTVIKVLTINSLNGEAIKVLSLSLANAWKSVDKYQKNGILILLAKEEKKIRIELGKGVLSYISSEDANNILLDIFRPFAKKEAYYAGVDSLTTVLMERLDGAFEPSYWQWLRQYKNEMVIIVLFITILIFSYHHTNGPRKDKLEATFHLIKLAFVIGLVVMPWFLGQAYISNNVLTGRLYWSLGLILMYVLAAIIALFVIMIISNNRSLIRKKEKSRKEEEEIKEWKTLIEKRILLLEQKYHQYLGKVTGQEWEEKERSRLKTYTSPESFKKYAEGLRLRVGDLEHLKKVDDFFEQNQASELMDFYPKQLVKIYLKKLKDKLLVVPPTSFYYYTLLTDILTPLKLQRLPFFEDLISVEDIDAEEIKSWLQRWKRTKGLHKYAHYPILLENGKAATNEKRILNKMYQKIEETQQPEQVYVLLLELIGHWQDFNLLDLYNRSIKQTNLESRKTLPLLNDNKNIESSSWDSIGDDNYDIGGDDDVFGGDGGDTSW